MDFQLSEEQKHLVALAKDFGKREITPEFMKGFLAKHPKDRIPYCREQGIVKKVHELGFKTLTIPEKYGGGGADLLTEVIVAEAIAQYCGPIPAMFMSSWKLIRDMAAFGTEEQKERLFKRLMDDPNFFLGQSATEPDHGCDPRVPYDEPGQGLKTFAYRDGDEYVINGEKCFQTGATSDLLFVYLTTDKKKPISKSMSVIMVPTDTPGYSIEKTYELMNEGIRPVCDVLFDNVRVPVTNLLGQENKGYPLFEGRYAFCLAAPAVVVGQAQRIYELTKEHAKTRIQGGKPIYEHPTIGSLIVDMHIKIEDLKARVYRTAWETDRLVEAGGRALSSLPFYLCDIVSHETQRLVAGNASEIWGGRGALRELPIEGYVRSVWTHNHEFMPYTVDRIKCSQILDGDPYVEM